MAHILDLRGKKTPAETRGAADHVLDLRGKTTPNSFEKPRHLTVKHEALKRAKTGKVEKVMKEFKNHKLHSGSKHGPKVTGRKQAIAIAMSEARKNNKKRK